MNILRELKTILEAQGVPVETGIFSDEAPDEYAVVTPMADTFADFADNMPQIDAQEARISIFTKGNYQSLKQKIVNALLGKGFTVTGRLYIEYETETGYHHYAIDATNYYKMED